MSRDGYLSEKEFNSIGSRIIRDYWNNNDKYKQISYYLKKYWDKDIDTPWDDGADDANLMIEYADYEVSSDEED